MNLHYSVRTKLYFILLLLFAWGLFANASTTTTQAAEADPNKVTSSTATVSTTATFNEAIADFNAQTSGNHVIELETSVTLNVPSLPINNPTAAHLTIDGRGNFALNGDSSFRVLAITKGNVTVDGLTIFNGRAPSCAGIDNVGSLTVNKSVILENVADDGSGGGGLCNRGLGTLTVSESTISSNRVIVEDNRGQGGGIDNYSTAVIMDSEISGNSAGFGAGIHNRGSLTISDNTIIKENTAEYRAGGIYNDNSLTVNDSTISGNSASGHNGIGSDTWSSDGGGIYNIAGTTTLNNSTLTGNTAYRGGGIFNRNSSRPSTVNVNNSTITRNRAAYGGGIENWDILDVDKSTISSNTASGSAQVGDSTGGGIRNIGELVLRQSVLSGNGAAFRGGAINNSGTMAVGSSTFFGNGALSGGGIFNSGTTTIGNSTFSSNSSTPSAGGGIKNLAKMTITNSTITNSLGGAIDNGGGAGDPPTLIVNNSILANGRGNDPDCDFATGSPPSIINSIVEDGSCGVTTGTNRNLTGDPSLGPLANNGGPTQTHALQTGSIAIDAGNSIFCNDNLVNGKDQRGRDREAQCDIGAYEEPTSGQCAATPDDGATVQFSNDSSALQRAILGSSPGGKVKIAGTCTGSSQQLVEGQTTTDTLPVLALITHSLTLEGGYTAPDWENSLFSNPAVLDADGGRVIILQDPTSSGKMQVKLDLLTIRNGKADVGFAPFDKKGGGIYVSGGVTLNLDYSTVTDNEAEFGAGLYVPGGTTVIVNSSTISDNEASKDGGGIFNDGDTTIGYSTLSKNKATNGGAVFNKKIAAVNNSTFMENSATANGGGIFSSGTTTVDFSKFQENEAGAAGGGILVSANSGPMTIINSSFVGNNAATTGGGIYNGDTVTVKRSSFFGNNANQGGGILNDVDATADISNSTLSNNFGVSSGGGLFNNGSATVINSTFADNLTDTGPGSSIFNQGTATVKNSILAYPDGSLTCEGTPPAISSSLVDDGSCGVTDGTDGNLTGDPLLGPRNDVSNGGPTSTRRLLAGSKAIDAADNDVCNAEPINGLDQRGVTRDASCDMGAYEFDADAVIISWAEADYIVNEGDGTVTLTVELHKESTSQIRVDYATTGGSDFTPKSETLTFAPGETSQEVEISITDDAVGEQPEKFYVTLSNPVNGALGTPRQATVTIIDDDNPLVSFSSASYSVDENGTTATLTVQLDRSANSEVTVDYETQDLTATAGVDYTAKSGTVTFAPDQTSMTIEVEILDDAVPESPKTFLVLLSNPVNAGLGTVSEAAVTIIDDDSPETKPKFPVFLPTVIR